MSAANFSTSFLLNTITATWSLITSLLLNPIPETRVLDWILSDSDEGPSTGKEERASEGEAKWVTGLPHVCEHKCLATTKRCRGSGEEGVEDPISDSGNDYDDGKASFSESHCLFTCSIDGA
jgi:hypothetical protein